MNFEETNDPDGEYASHKLACEEKKIPGASRHVSNVGDSCCPTAVCQAPWAAY